VVVLFQQINIFSITTKGKIVNWNQTKNNENRRNVGLNQGRRKSDVEIDVLAESRLSFLKTTLINLINTSKHSSMSVDRALTGFYKEVNKSIKRN
jgi:hypothetical protein